MIPRYIEDKGIVIKEDIARVLQDALKMKGKEFSVAPYDIW